VCSVCGHARLILVSSHTHSFVRVRVRVRECVSESAMMCVRESVSVCVCETERASERGGVRDIFFFLECSYLYTHVFVCVCERERVCRIVCICVGVSE